MATYSSIKYNFTPPAATVSAQVGAGAMTLIKELTASSDGTLSFVDGTSDVVLDNTYKTYIWKFINAHPSSEQVFQFQCSTDGGSNYNLTVTSTAFYNYHQEDDSAAGLTYYTSADQAQGTSFEWLTAAVDNANDSGASGELWLFNPSNTTFIKNFIAVFDNTNSSPYQLQLFKKGYFNTTSAIDAIQFKFASGDIDTGTIKMYGIT